jgi:hypothetical protein
MQRMAFLDLLWVYSYSWAYLLVGWVECVVSGEVLWWSYV